jgi:4-hydroxy-2-oxoheptanedioate aldolase
MADEKLARHYIELGAQFVAVGVDSTVLARSAEALAGRFKTGGQQAGASGVY